MKYEIQRKGSSNDNTSLLVRIINVIIAIIRIFGKGIG